MRQALCSVLCMHNLFKSSFPTPRRENTEAQRGDKFCPRPVRGKTGLGATRVP